MHFQNALNIYWDNNRLPPLHMVIEARTSLGSPIFRELNITTTKTICSNASFLGCLYIESPLQMVPK